MNSLALASSVFALLAVACASSGSSGYEAKQLADGTLRLKCQGALPACIAHAETACHGNNYEILKARDQRDTYGPEYGTSRVEVRSSEAIVRCGAKGQPAPALPPDPVAGTPDAPPHPHDPSVADAIPPAPPPRSCVPGSTQACIGPGRCEGGQSCLPDGTAFGPCDCGTLGPPPVAPSGSGAPANPPAPPSASGTHGTGTHGAPPPSAAPGSPPSSTTKPPAARPVHPPPPAGGATPLKK